MRSYVSIAAALLLVSACDGGGRGTVEPALQASAQGVTAGATGGGHYLLADLVDVQFSLSAVQNDDGRASGDFHILFADAGFFYDIHGNVTCMAVDPVNHRAWVGGVVTRNESTDPDLQTDIHQVGRDVWFRMLDGGNGPGTVDRITFYGFEGAAGITTSAEYCAARIWAPDNARTWAVTEGNITIRP